MQNDFREIIETELDSVNGGYGSVCDAINDAARDAGRAVGRAARFVKNLGDDDKWFG